MKFLRGLEEGRRCSGGYPIGVFWEGSGCVLGYGYVAPVILMNAVFFQVDDVFERSK